MNTITSILLSVDIDPQTGIASVISCSYTLTDANGFTKGKQAILSSLDNALQQIQALEGLQVTQSMQVKV